MSRTSRNAYGTLRSHAIAGPPRRLSRGPRSGGPRSGTHARAHVVGAQTAPAACGQVRRRPKLLDIASIDAACLGRPIAKARARAVTPQSTNPAAGTHGSDSRATSSAASHPTARHGLPVSMGPKRCGPWQGAHPIATVENQIGPCRRPCRLSTRHGPARHDRPRAGACWHEVGGRPPPSGTLQR